MPRCLACASGALLSGLGSAEGATAEALRLISFFGVQICSNEMVTGCLLRVSFCSYSGILPTVIVLFYLRGEGSHYQSSPLCFPLACEELQLVSKGLRSSGPASGLRFADLGPLMMDAASGMKRCFVDFLVIFDLII